MRGNWLLSVVFVAGCATTGCVTVGRVVPEPVPVVEPVVEPAPAPQPEPPPTEVASPEPVEQPTVPVEPAVPDPPAVAVEEGMASYYARRFEGRRTANGERYRRLQFTCAHREHPFGTVLQITAVATGKQATCRVNDRGPFKKSRILDVSGAVAHQLGMVGPGVLLVRVTVEQPASTSTEPTPPSS
jgi:rare lipoprotein A